MPRIIIVLIVGVLLIAAVFFGLRCLLAQFDLKQIYSTMKVNNNVLLFNRLFVDKVLKAQGEVSYEDRLLLERAVYATNDKGLIDTWHIFLASQTEKEAQQNVLKILSLLPATIID
jgi:hypothetical protein